MPTEEQKQTIGPVLGRVPSGVFILVAGNKEGQQTGLLASWIQQASFEPPQVTVAVNKTRYLNEWLDEGAPVTINQVASDDGGLFRHFGKGFDPDVPAFEGLDIETASSGLPILKGSLSSMEGTVVSQMEAGDHMIYLVEITDAVAHREPNESQPFVHIRKSGFNY